VGEYCRDATALRPLPPHPCHTAKVYAQVLRVAGPGVRGYGFNITNAWGKPLVLFAYDTQGAAEAARAQIKLAIEEAYDVRPWDEWGVGGLSKDDKF
jgi:hypothetical protein